MSEDNVAMVLILVCTVCSTLKVSSIAICREIEPHQSSMVSPSSDKDMQGKEVVDQRDTRDSSADMIWYAP